MLRYHATLAVTLLALPSIGHSQAITMTHEGTAAGVLSGISFNESPFIVTCSGDISDRETVAGYAGYWIDHTSATMNIQGLGSVTLETPTLTFVNNSSTIVGLSRSRPAGIGLDLFNGPTLPVLGTWDMLVPIGPLTGTGFTLQWTNGDIVTSGGVLDVSDNEGLPCVFRADIGEPTVGIAYCTASANSTGWAGMITASGSDEAALNDLTLTADKIPTQSFGMFLASQTQDFQAGFGASAGNLCLGGAIGRFAGGGQVLSSGAGGRFSLAIDLASIPTPTGPTAVQAGETWSFQAWHRDSVGGQSTSNFTNGLQVTFR